MSSASLGLCKELYHLSNWHEGVDEWFDSTVTTDIVPAYDLGYLLRKLPLVELKHVALDSDDLKRWNCISPHWGTLRNHFAETPEDAACELAIELFKKGILTRLI